MREPAKGNHAFTSWLFLSPIGFLTVFFLFVCSDPVSKIPRAIFLILTILTLFGALAVATTLLQRSGLKAALKNSLSNVLLVFGSLMIALLAIEGLFMLVERSHSVGYSLAAQSWFRTYWRTNSKGYRERESTEIADLASRRKVVVIGDSFAAGHGISNPDDRFSNRLEGFLPKNWVVLNFGQNGIDSKTQLKIVEKLELQPEVIVLSYFGNDIMESAIELGLKPNKIEPYKDLQGLWAKVIPNFYFTDFIYWLWPREDLANWWSYYDRAYSDPQIVANHKRDMEGLIRAAKDRGSHLLVVIFPYLHDLERSEIYYPMVASFFSERNIPWVDVRSLVKDLPLEKRVVNLNDVHANEVVHQRVGEAIYRKMAQIVPELAEPR
ncbi:MAG: SGNH/GDSL hydrolase family protein [Bdellovibrionales bacterium]